MVITLFFLCTFVFIYCFYTKMSLTQSISNQELTGLDLSKVAALQQKRTVAFVNHFAVTTVQFLNSFMKQCEEKLMRFERQLEKVEAAMVLLEARLSSIPEVSGIQAEQKVEMETKVETNPAPIVNTPENNEDKEPADESESVKTEANPAPSHPEYDRFLKMVSVGVPLEAVKLKLSAEGLDPNVFVKLVKSK